VEPNDYPSLEVFLEVKRGRGECGECGEGGKNRERGDKGDKEDKGDKGKNLLNS